MPKKTKPEILDEILELEEQCGSIIDAITTVCYKHKVELETIAQYIKYSKELKERVRLEGATLNLFKNVE